MKGKYFVVVDLELAGFVVGAVALFVVLTLAQVGGMFIAKGVAAKCNRATVEAKGAK